MRRGLRLKNGETSKYRARPVTVDGIRFDSTREYTRYAELRLLFCAKEIKDLHVHPQYFIHINDIQVCIVELDFAYHDKAGVLHVEDVKGMDTALSRLKRRMVEAAHGFKVEVLK